MLKLICWLMLIAGVVTGPAYWIYINYYTGKTTDTYPLQRQDARHLITPPITITPAMSPAGVSFQSQARFSRAASGARPSVEYLDAILHQGQATAQPLRFQLKAVQSAEAAPLFNERLLLLHAQQPSQYQVEIVSPPDAQVTLENSQIQIQHNVQVADPRVVTVGVMMFSLGLLLLLIL